MTPETPVERRLRPWADYYAEVPLGPTSRSSIGTDRAA